MGTFKTNLGNTISEIFIVILLIVFCIIFFIPIVFFSLCFELEDEGDDAWHKDNYYRRFPVPKRIDKT